METSGDIDIQDPEKLFQEFQLRGKFYKKGFAILFIGINCDLDIWESIKKPELEASARSQCQQMKAIYQGMLEDGLADSPDADILLPIVQTLDELEWEIEKIFTQNAPTDRAFELTKSIYKAGQLLRSRLYTMQKELRTHQGYEKARISATDIFGGHWDSVFGN